jgi:hypothetical protein
MATVTLAAPASGFLALSPQPRRSAGDVTLSKELHEQQRRETHAVLMGFSLRLRSGMTARI